MWSETSTEQTLIIKITENWELSSNWSQRKEDDDGKLMTTGRSLDELAHVVILYH